MHGHDIIRLRVIVQGVYEGLSENVKECKKKGVGYLRLSASQSGTQGTLDGSNLRWVSAGDQQSV